MIKHIVMIQLKAFDSTTKSEHLLRLKTQLDKLPELIPEIKNYETGINHAESPNAYDFVLISAFDSIQDLKTYSKHPDHQKVLTYINEISDERKVVDFESKSTKNI